LEYLGIDGRIILKWILKMGLGVWSELMWLRIGTVAGCCGHGNEPSGSIKCVEFLG
jgi:hypothetical protein